MTRIYQAIITKYFGPTNHLGSRIKAQCAAKYIYVHYDHALSIEKNHAAAAEKLATALDWKGTWYGGGLPDNSGNCYVQADSNETAFTVIARDVNAA